MLEYAVVEAIIILILVGIFRRVDKQDAARNDHPDEPDIIRPLPIYFYLLSFYMPATIYGLIIWEKTSSFLLAFIMSIAFGAIHTIFTLVIHTTILESRQKHRN